jgi:transglutaminase-like putative cysteine protease
MESFDPARDALKVEYAERRNEMEFTFTNRAGNQSLLYSPAETVWVSKNARVQSAPTDGASKDAASWSAETRLTEGEQYKTKSFVADPTVEELRAAGAEYPNWVKERYLQVPQEIEPQLRELTLQITESQQTPYDKAQAVTLYLRNEIEYSDAIEEAPSDALDPVLWVLFELKKGFCMYYASAETLMLRSIGIPARMAVGFVEGDYDEEDRRYSVAYKDSHAWSEVYFPGIGWVEFEPTRNQFPIERPERRVEADEINEELNGAESRAENLPLPAAPLREESGELENNSEASVLGVKAIAAQRYILPVLLALGLGAAVFAARRFALGERLPAYLLMEYERRGAAAPLWLKRWARWASLSPIERAFQSVNLSLYWLGKPQAAHVTSTERAKVLLDCLPEAHEDIFRLLEEYHNALYTPRGGSAAQARKAAVQILVKARVALIKEALQSADRRYNQLK